MNHSLGRPPTVDPYRTPPCEVVPVRVAARARSSGWWQVLGLVGASAVAVFVVQRWATSLVCVDGSSEARMMLQQIRGAEASYFAEHGEYRGCTTANGLADAQSYYPRPLTELGERQVDWTTGYRMGAPLEECWRKLGVRPSGPVRGAYAVVTGPAGPIVAARPPGVAAEDWPFDGRSRSAEPYFIAVAASVDREGRWSMAYSASTENDVVEIPID